MHFNLIILAYNSLASTWAYITYFRMESEIHRLFNRNHLYVQISKYGNIEIWRLNLTADEKGK